MLPSGWTFRGMLAHLAFDDERFWCRAVLAAEPEVTAAVLAGEPYAWTLLTEMSPSEVLEVYRNETDRWTPIIASRSRRRRPPGGHPRCSAIGGWPPTAV